VDTVAVGGRADTEREINTNTKPTRPEKKNRK